jgi:flagellar biosynthesis protein FlhF
MTLADVQNKHLVLIDTVGMSQRDRRLAEQVALLCGNGKRVKRLLLISATAQGATLEDVARAYQGPGLEGCILTKIDEALSLGSALDVSIRHQLKLHFVTNGQRVPEDMHLANPLYLVDRAMKAMQEAGAPFSFQDSDYPLVMAAMAATERSAPNREAYGG